VLKVKFNLTHVASNIELSLHKRQINITYWYKGKYLNSSSGAMPAVLYNKDILKIAKLTVYRVEY
jgi:kynureninase